MQIKKLDEIDLPTLFPVFGRYMLNLYLDALCVVGVSNTSTFSVLNVI
jgi:hypothetical protein